MKAISIEATLLKTSLEQAAQQAENFAGRVTVSGHAPQLVPRWGTMVFDTQLGKLRDVADELVSQIIEAYTRVGQLEQIVDTVNECSQVYVSAKSGNEKAEAQSRLTSALRVFEEEAKSTASKFKELQKLLNK